MLSKQGEGNDNRAADVLQSAWLLGSVRRALRSRCYNVTFIVGLWSVLSGSLLLASAQ